MIFYSKVDWWFAIVMVATALISIHSIYTVFSRAPLSSVWYVMVLIFVVGVLFPVSILSTTKYQIVGHTLDISSGPFSWKIEINSIKSIRRSSSLIASPALSMNRIELEHSKGRILVSPSGEKEFLKALNAVRDNKLSIEN
jgi:hypothetical protein